MRTAAFQDLPRAGNGWYHCFLYFQILIYFDLLVFGFDCSLLFFRCLLDIDVSI